MAEKAEKCIVVFSENVNLGKELYRNDRSIREVILPEGIRRIGEGCFEGCSGLYRINLPESLASIRKRAFAGCSSLKEITIPTQVRLLDKNAFAGCENLEKVTLKAEDIRIDMTAFSGCLNLDEESLTGIAGHLSTKNGQMRVNTKRAGEAGYLSNLTPREFLFDGVQCASIEGVLRSFTVAEEEEQRAICRLSGMEAHWAGGQWQESGMLYWKGRSYDRFGDEYQQLLNRLMEAVYQQDKKYRFILSMHRNWTYDCKMARNPAYTVMTREELCGRLEWLGKNCGVLKGFRTELRMEQVKPVNAGMSGTAFMPMPRSVYPEVKKVVVLGGSFNPPTVAHKKLLLTAVEAVEADIGIFLPAPFSYVQRKMKKTGEKQEALPDAVRLELLDMVCREDERLTVDDYEMYRTGKGFTFESLEAVAQMYPNAEVYFLVGCDKLHIIPRWHRIEEFMDRFRILAAKRGGEYPEVLLEENPYLSQHRENFYIFEISDELQKVSSSAVRKLLREKDDRAKEMLPEEVWEYMKRKYETDDREMPENSICRFREEYDFLSNFYPCRIEYEGLTYQNAEAAFQAQKCITQEEKQAFCGMPSAQSKRMGRKVALREDWEEVKTGIMEEIVRAKFTQNTEMKEKLLATGERTLIEGNTWGDTFWGVDIRSGAGENHLGQILMKVREELRIRRGL